MSDRTFRLILDGKKGGLVKGSSPSSAAKKACKKLSAELGKTSIKFELQETTKDSKKKVYGPYKGCLEKDKIKIKMAGGRPKGQQMDYVNQYGVLSIYTEPYNSTPEGKIRYNLLKKIPNQHEIKMRFDELYNMPLINIKNIKNLKSFEKSFEKQKNKLQELLKKYKKSNATNENKNKLQNKYVTFGKQNQELFKRFLNNADSAKINTKLNNDYARNIAKQIIVRDKGQNFLTNPIYKQLEERVKAKILAKINNNRYSKTNNPYRDNIYEITVSGEENSNNNSNLLYS